LQGQYPPLAPDISIMPIKDLGAGDYDTGDMGTTGKVGCGMTQR
jgi:hypothetical protein